MQGPCSYSFPILEPHFIVWRGQTIEHQPNQGGLAQAGPRQITQEYKHLGDYIRGQLIYLEGTRDI